MADRWENACCDGADEGVGSSSYYRQARLTSTGDLADIWLPESLIPAGPADFPFFNPDDELCYYIDYDDAHSTTPGTVIDGWEAIDDGGESDAVCDRCLSRGWFWSTGTKAEPTASLGFVRKSPTFELNAGEFTDFTFTAMSDDVVVLIHATDEVVVTGVLDGSGPITVTLPDDAIIFRNTTGHLIGLATNQKTFTDGTNSYVVDAGDGSNDGTIEVIDLETGGFTTRTWGTPVTSAELTSKTWVDGDGIARVKFVHVTAGQGFATITNMQCDAPAGSVEAFDTGEDFDPDPDPENPADCATDNRWTVNGQVPKLTELGGIWHGAPVGTSWISFNCDKTDTETDADYAYVTHVTLTGVNLALFSWPVEFAADQEVLDILVNGVSQGISEPPDAYGSLHAHTIPGTNFVNGDNTITVLTDGGTVVQGLLFLWGEATW